jgi:hypothetical protein
MICNILGFEYDSICYTQFTCLMILMIKTPTKKATPLKKTPPKKTTPKKKK